MQPNAIMKTRFTTAAVFLALILSLTMAEGQATINPATGEPLANGEAVPAIDPATGLPVGSAQEEAQKSHMKQRIASLQESSWKDPKWQDPTNVLANVDFPNIQLAEVARLISERFKGQFDIILPGSTDGNSINPLTSAPVSPNLGIDWPSETMPDLHLKDVTASELFHAMNLAFENNKTPLQWELKVNGHRQLALLRVLVDPAPHNDPQPPPVPLRRIYFVGDLIGDEKDGGMTMDQIVKTITDVWQMTDTTDGKIQFHNGAQLLIVTATPDQVVFVDQTLSALRQKVERARFLIKSQPKTIPDESKK